MSFIGFRSSGSGDPSDSKVTCAFSNSLFNFCFVLGNGEERWALQPTLTAPGRLSAWSLRTGDRVFSAQEDRPLMLGVGRLQLGSGNHTGGRERRAEGR